MPAGLSPRADGSTRAGPNHSNERRVRKEGRSRAAIFGWRCAVDQVISRPQAVEALPRTPNDPLARLFTSADY